MGVKKNGMTVLSGSLQTHWIRYVTELKIRVNPTDAHAIAMSNTFLKLMMSLRGEFVQPGFQWSREIGNTKNLKFNDPSILYLKFVNGYEKNYHMGYSKFPIIKAEIDYINHLIEYERSLAGQDDELEDEFVL